MIQPKAEIEDLLLSITKNCETLIDQTHRKAEETLEFKMIKPRDQVKGDWMLRLVGLEVNNSILDIKKEKNIFELYKFLDEKIGGISYERVRDEIERDWDISDITAADLQDDIIASFITEEYKEQVTKKLKDGGYMNILSIYTSSVFQDFESILRTKNNLVEDDIKLVLDEYNSSFITYELQPGDYRFKDISEALFNILRSEYAGPSNVIDFEFDNITRKAKLVGSSGIIAIGFDEKSFFSTVLGFTPGWDYKQYNEYISQKIVNLNTTNKIHLKCDILDGSIQDGKRQPILFSFVLDKPSGYKVFCEPEIIHYKKMNKSVLNTANFD